MELYRQNIQYNNIEFQKELSLFFSIKGIPLAVSIRFVLHIYFFFMFLLGYNNELRRHVHVYRRRRHSAPLLDWLSERKQIH